ncbi:MAG TPA: hypothetical protein VN761_10085 [Candidatus Polarisedimenticolia bacterium]|nr:hypothetical protein [Candidatus Polarisedimenticolia bacterium]
MANPKQPLKRSIALITLLSLGVLFSNNSRGQAPSIVWRTNVNATLFAVDSQTNIYANANGTVITLNSRGVPFATNSYCPVPSLDPEFAQRDSAGNFYFAGNFDGTNNFGGTNLVGGWIDTTNYDTPRWHPGAPTCFLAKYTPNGGLLWATSFGQVVIDDDAFGEYIFTNQVSDLVLNPDGSATVGVYQYQYSEQIALISSTGSPLWLNPIFDYFSVQFGPVKLSSLRGTNGAFLLYSLAVNENTVGFISEGNYTSSGSIVVHSGFVYYPLSDYPGHPLSSSGKPVTTLGNETYLVGLSSGNPLYGQFLIEEYAPNGSIVWTQTISNFSRNNQWILNGDDGGNIYLSGLDRSFSKYNSAGMQIWTTNYTSPTVIGLADSSGNHIIQFADNTIAFLAADPGSTAPTAHLNRQAGDGRGATGFQFSLSGSPGCVYEVFSSTDLNSWQSLAYVTNNTADIQILDPDATNHLQKFYRVSP